MFREDFYRMLRDDFERLEFSGEAGAERLPLLGRFLKEEKEENIRILIRRDRLKVVRAKNADELRVCLKNGFRNLLDFMEQQQARIWKCEEREALLRFMGIKGDVDAKKLKKALGQRRERNEIFFENVKKREELEIRKENLIAAGRMVIGLWEGAAKEDPYIALRTEYLDYQLQERTGNELQEKARSIYQRKYIIEDEQIRKILTAEADAGGEKELAEAVEQLLEAILKAEAKAFLYDAGFPLQNRDKKKKKTTDGKTRKKGRKKKKKKIENYCLDAEEPDEGEVEEYEDEPREKQTGAEKEKSIPRRQDRVMELIEYCERNGVFRGGEAAFGTGSASAALDSAQFRESAGKLREALSSEERTEAFIPLYIDEKTGGGIYIIGKDLIPQQSFVDWTITYREEHEKPGRRLGKRELDKRIEAICVERCCHFCYVSGVRLVSVKGKNLKIDLDVRICVNIGEAIKFCHKAQDPDNYEMGSYEMYRVRNKELIENVEERYRHYFYEDDSDWGIEDDADLDWK